MYFDAVLDKDLKPMFNGTPEATRQWIEDQKIQDLAFVNDLQVCDGRNMRMYSVREYLYLRR